MNLRHLPALAAVLVLAASCTSGTSGIFASIEREQAIVSNGGLSKTSTITSMAQLNGTVNKYFATGGKSLFTRSTDPEATAWTATTVGGNTQVTAVGSTADPTTTPTSPASYTPHAVYAVAGGGLYVTTDGATWAAPTFASGSATIGSNDAPATLIPLVRGDGYTSTDLVLVTGNSTLGATDSSGTAAVEYGDIYIIQGKAGAVSGSTVPDKLIGPITLNVDVTTTSDPSTVWKPWVPQLLSAADDGSSYWFLARGSLWTYHYSGTPSTALQPVAGTPASALSLRAIGTTLFLGTDVNSNSSTGGGLYTATSSAGATTLTWTALASSVTTSTGSYPVSFRTFLLNPQTGKLWVGTGSSGTSVVGNGYFEITGPTTTPSFSKTIVDSNVDNYSSSSLSTQFVGGLFWGTNQDGTHTMFLGTMAYGLWAWDPATGKWSQQ
jgi:hypothetical protein